MRKKTVLLSIFSAIQATLTVSVAFFTRNLIDAAIAKENWIVWCILLVAATVAVPVLRGISSIYAHRITDREICDKRVDILKAIEVKELDALNAYHSGVLQNRLMTDVRVLVERYTRVIPGFVGLVAQLACAFGVLVILKPGVAFIVIAVGAAGIFISNLVRKELRKRYRKVRDAEENISGAITENLENIELIKSLGATDQEAKRIEGKHVLWYEIRKKYLNYSVGSSAIFSLGVQICSVGLIIWGAYQMAHGALSFGTLTAMIQLVALFKAPISGMTELQTTLALSDAARERIDELYAMPEESTAPQPTAPIAVQADAVPEEPAASQPTAVHPAAILEESTAPQPIAVPKGYVPVSLVFEHVDFAYKDGSEVFRDFNTRINLKKWTIITGMSGKGKSTLYRLILGLYKPDNGKIYLECSQIDTARKKKKTAGTQPIPTGTQPTPEGTQPTPEETQPTPEGTQPTPEGTQPTPEGTQPTPAGTQPTPAGIIQVPVGPQTRSLFGISTQTPVLFSGTAKENLLLTCPNATEKEISEALEIAQCDFLHDLPKGIDTKFGQFGEGLSVGQRQRLAIARVVLMRPKILLLDEITASLDNKTATSLINALSDHFPCAIFASHHGETLSEGSDKLDLNM